MNRTLNVVRMQLVNRATYIWVPLIILGGTLLISLAIFGLISSSGADAQMFGAARRHRCGTSVSSACRPSP